MIRTTALALALAAAAAVPATGSAAPQINVSVNPGTLILAGHASQTLTVMNAGDVASTIDVGVGNYAISPEGAVQIDPPLEPARSARRWLTVSPSRLDLAPRQSAVVTVVSKPPHIASPGDHHALVMLTGRSDGGSSSPVRVVARVGVGTLVRVPGALRRNLQVHGLTVHRAKGVKVFRIGLSNKGNVNERLARGQVTVVLRRGGAVVARLKARTRSILPGTSGIVAVPYRGPVRGVVTATATVTPTPAALAGPGIAGLARPVVRTATLTL
jgi:hypothetical protein